MSASDLAVRGDPAERLPGDLAVRGDPAERVRGDLAERAWAALDEVLDPELDEPVTDLGFVRSLGVEGGTVRVHLRLPTSFCSPNFAFLMAADARAALGALDGVDRVIVELDDHHDSDVINRGLAAGADFVGTFGPEAEEDLDELRWTFRRKAHTAAMERAITAALQDPGAPAGVEAHTLLLRDLPAGRERETLVRRRAALGFDTDDRSPVLVDDTGAAVPAADAPRRLRQARLARISMDGNAMFCRGLLRTRYPESALDQVPRPGDEQLASIPVTVLPTRRREA